MSTTNGRLSTMSALVEESRTSPAAPPREPSVGRVLWDAWKAYTARAGAYQGQVLLSLVYFLVLGPSAIVAQVFGARLLDLDTKPRSSYWVDRPRAERSIAALQRQF